MLVFGFGLRERWAWGIVFSLDLDCGELWDPFGFIGIITQGP